MLCFTKLSYDVLNLTFVVLLTFYAQSCGSNLYCNMPNWAVVTIVVICLNCAVVCFAVVVCTFTLMGSADMYYAMLYYGL